MSWYVTSPYSVSYGVLRIGYVNNSIFVNIYDVTLPVTLLKITIPANCPGLHSEFCRVRGTLYVYVRVFPPLSESRSGIKQNKTDLDKSDTQEVVGGYYGVQHDAKELHVGPKRID